MIEWPNQKKSRVRLHCKFLKDAGTAKNCQKVVPNITKPLPHHLWAHLGTSPFTEPDRSTPTDLAIWSIGSGTVATGERLFLPDPPPPAGLVYILNFPSVCVCVCVSVCLSVPRVFSMIEWPNQKKSRVGLYCKFLKDAGTAKKLPKSGPEHHETSPAPCVVLLRRLGAKYPHGPARSGLVPWRPEGACWII